MLISDENHILRHVTLNDYGINDSTGEAMVYGSAFIDEPRHEGKVSYAWREFHQGAADKYEQVALVRDEFHRKFKKTDLLAELNLMSCYQQLETHFPDISSGIHVEHNPLLGTDRYPQPFGSHALMVGVPDNNSPIAEAIGDIIAEALSGAYPAVVAKE